MNHKQNSLYAQGKVGGGEQNLKEHSWKQETYAAFVDAGVELTGGLLACASCKGIKKKIAYLKPCLQVIKYTL